jgi:hypothetical protein
MITGVPEHMLARVLGAAASDVDGVRTARAKVRGRHVTVVARTDLRETSPVEERVRAAVERRLGELAPVRPMTVRTRMRGAP